MAFGLVSQEAWATTSLASVNSQQPTQIAFWFQAKEKTSRWLWYLSFGYNNIYEIMKLLNEFDDKEINRDDEKMII